jgi:hypothetical protein
VILGAMRGAGHVVTEINPFEKPLPAVLPGGRPESPYVQRLRLMWAGMREQVAAAFPPAPGTLKDIDALLKDVEARYVTDAYHSLSIEGYRVTATLIEKIRDGHERARAGEFLCKHRVFGGFHRRTCKGAGTGTSSSATRMTKFGPRLPIDYEQCCIDRLNPPPKAGIGADLP